MSLDRKCIYYTIKKGDTLSAIARKYDTTVEAIKGANCYTLDEYNLPVGGVIKVPVY